MAISDSTVLVTGGAGFIGSHVVRDLLENDADVHVIDNEFAGDTDLLPDTVPFTDLDIRDAEEVTRVVTDIDPDVIVHLAAIHHIPYCNENPEEAFNVNVMGTRNVLDAARELDDLDLVSFASSAAVYPPRDEANQVDSALGPIDIYGRTKLLGEDLLRLFQIDTGVPTVAARLFNVFGPRETNSHLIPAVLEQVLDGSREIELGNLSPRRDFIHVSDVSAAFLAFIDDVDDGHNVYNVGTGVEHSVQGVVEAVAEALGEEIEITQNQDRVRDQDREHLKADISRTRAETGWRPTVEFVDGLRPLVDDDSDVEPIAYS